MSARELVFENDETDREVRRSRTGWSMGVSTALHVFAFVLLTAARPVEQVREDLIEVTMLEDSGAPSAVAAAPAASPRSGDPVAGAVDPQPSERRFERELRRADISPEPQSDVSIADQISSRLAAMRETRAPISAGSALGAAPSLVASPAAITAAGTGSSPIALHRGKGLGGTGLTLDRGGSGSGAALTAVAPAMGNALEAAEAPREERAARQAASADLTGPIADRRIVRQVTPVYPEWAKRDGVEGSVTLYFIVRADGTIRENVLIQRTAGFGDFDENARVALRDWRFEPLRRGETGEQWGTITLNYRLRGN